MRPIAAMACSVLVFCWFGFFMCIFVYTAVTMRKYTPIYRSMECGPHSVWLRTVTDSAGGRHSSEAEEGGRILTGAYERRCDNLNVYPLEIEAAPVQVFVQAGGELVPAGTGNSSRAVFPAGGFASSLSDIRLVVPASLQENITVEHPLALITTTVIKVRFDMDVVLSMRIPILNEFRQACGFQVIISDDRVFAGPLSCAGSLETLRLPPLRADAPHQLWAMAERDMGAQKKDFVFSTILCVSGLLAVLTLVLGVRHEGMRLAVRRRRLEESEAKRLRGLFRRPPVLSGSGTVLTEADDGHFDSAA